MIISALLLGLNVYANDFTLNCEQRYPSSSQWNCFRACEDGILNQCRGTVAEVDLAKSQTPIHSSQLKYWNEKFIASYQTVKGGLGLDVRIEALATAEYNEDYKEIPTFSLIDKPEPTLVVKKGSSGNFVMPLTITKDCPVIKTYVGGLSQAQGLMLSGYIAMFNKCEGEFEKTFGYETFQSKVRFNALEMASRKDLAPGVEPLGFLMGTLYDGKLILDVRAYRPYGYSLEKATRELKKWVVSISRFKYSALQKTITLTLKNYPKQTVAFYPLMKPVFSNINTVMFKTEPEKNEQGLTRGPTFTFESEVMPIEDPSFSFTTKQFTLYGDLIEGSAIVHIPNPQNLRLGNSLRFITTNEASNLLKDGMNVTGFKPTNATFFGSSKASIQPELSLVKLNTRNEKEAYVILKNKNPKTLSFSLLTGPTENICLEGEVLGLTDGVKPLSRARLATNAEGISKISNKKVMGKHAEFCFSGESISLKSIR